MRITVIGASRGIGKALTTLALDQGHEVTAFQRRPAALGVTHPRLRIIGGDILDADDVASAVAGSDAVCLCTGIPPTRKPVDVFSRGAEAVLAAMKSAQVTKLITVTGIGAGDSKGHGGFLYDCVVNPLLLGTIYADKDREERLVMASPVEWLIVRPGFLTNGPLTGKYRVIDDLSGVTAGKISRADVADFMLKQLTSPTHFGKTPLLSY